jgi:hypothetical protein
MIRAIRRRQEVRPLIDEVCEGAARLAGRKPRRI